MSAELWTQFCCRPGQKIVFDQHSPTWADDWVAVTDANIAGDLHAQAMIVDFIAWRLKQ